MGSRVHTYTRKISTGTVIVDILRSNGIQGLGLGTLNIGDAGSRNGVEFTHVRLGKMLDFHSHP